MKQRIVDLALVRRADDSVSINVTGNGLPDRMIWTDCGCPNCVGVAIRLAGGEAFARSHAEKRFTPREHLASRVNGVPLGFFPFEEDSGLDDVVECFAVRGTLSKDRCHG